MKFIYHKYDIISDLEKRLFTSIVQYDSYFDKIYELQEFDGVIFQN